MNVTKKIRSLEKKVDKYFKLRSQCFYDENDENYNHYNWLLNHSRKDLQNFINFVFENQIEDNEIEKSPEESGYVRWETLPERYNELVFRLDTFGGYVYATRRGIARCLRDAVKSL